MLRRSKVGGNFWMPMKNWSYRVFRDPDIFLELVQLGVFPSRSIEL